MENRFFVGHTRIFDTLHFAFCGGNRVESGLISCGEINGNFQKSAVLSDFDKIENQILVFHKLPSVQKW